MALLVRDPSTTVIRGAQSPARAAVREEMAAGSPPCQPHLPHPTLGGGLDSRRCQGPRRRCSSICFSSAGVAERGHGRRSTASRRRISSSSNPDFGLHPGLCVCVCGRVRVRVPPSMCSQSDRCSSHRLARAPSRECRGRGQSSRVASGSFPLPAVESASREDLLCPGEYPSPPPEYDRQAHEFSVPGRLSK